MKVCLSDEWEVRNVCLVGRWGRRMKGVWKVRQCVWDEGDDIYVNIERKVHRQTEREIIKKKQINRGLCCTVHRWQDKYSY